MAKFPNTIEAVRRVTDVSRETEERLEHYVDLLFKWQKAQNLVSPKTLGEVWSRHIADCAQMQNIVSEPAVWADFGSGAGLPGLITAILQRDFEQGADHNNRVGHVHLVESNQRKASFLRTVIRELDLSASMHACRIEDFNPPEDLYPTHLSARALAPLDTLLGVSERFCQQNSVCYFHKGRDIHEEIKVATNQWDFDLVKYDSRVADDSCIVEIQNVRRRDIP